MRSEKLSFRNALGQSLAARLDLPVAERPVAYALFAHCFTCTKNLKAVANINAALASAGIAVLRFDFTGLGESEGEFADSNFSSNVEDLIAAAQFLEARGNAPQILLGHSLGGSAMLQAASAIASARVVATIGSPASPDHVTRLLAEGAQQIEAQGEATVKLAGRPFRIKKQFLDDLRQHKLGAATRNLNKALLIFHSPVDQVVDVDNAAQIFTAARHPKSFISLDRADHLLSDEEDSRYVGTVLAAWARKYLAIENTPEQHGLTPNGVVARIDRSHYRTEINANGHSLIADEPRALGGGNSGASPYDYLVAALGACTAMTLRMYADRKNWPLEAVQVDLRHQTIHAQDCADCETKTGQIDQIERELTLIGALSAEQRERLKQIADKCPVHRTLHSEIKVRTTVRD